MQRPVSGPKFGIASLPRAIQSRALVLTLSLSLSSLLPPSSFLLSLSFSSSPSLFALVYVDTNGVSEFESAVQGTRGALSTILPAQLYVCAAHGHVEIRARPMDKFLTTLHLGAAIAVAGPIACAANRSYCTCNSSWIFGAIEYADVSVVKYKD